MTDRRYLLMLALVQDSKAKAGYLGEETIWAVVEETELLNLFTVVNPKHEPMKPHPFIRTCFGKLADVADTPMGLGKSLVHTLILHQRPSPRVDALLKIIKRIKSRSITWAQFSNKYKKKGWPELMKKLAKRADSSKLSNLAVGMIYIVLTPETAFTTLRAELKGLGVLNPVRAIERFVEYIDEIPDEEFSFSDVESMVGQKLLSISSQPASYGVEETNEGFILSRTTTMKNPKLVDIYQREMSDTSTAQLKTRITQEPEESDTTLMDVSTSKTSDTEAAHGIIKLKDTTSTHAYETPNVDEDIDWDEIKEIIETEKETRYIELKQKVDFKNRKQLKRFIKAFIGLANRSLKDNHRSKLIIGTLDSIPDSPFYNDASYQELVDNYIRPKPEFTFIPHKKRKFEIGVFLIQPVGERPYILSKDLVSKDDDIPDYPEGACFIRNGTRTDQLDEDGQFSLMRDIVWKYGRR